jgi:IS5 family transposase
MVTDGSMTASSMASSDENPRSNARSMETVVKDRVDSRTSTIVSRRDDEGMITCASIKRETAMREIMIAASLRLDPYFASIRVSSRVAACDEN